MSSTDTGTVGRSLVDFALQGSFPDEVVSSRSVGSQDFGPALQSLAVAKSKIESEIHVINEETAPDVQSWVANAKTLERDINRSRLMANEIVRRSEAPEVSGQTLRETEERVQFLQRETRYNRQVHQALTKIKYANALMNEVEDARDERRVLESLHLLEKSWAAIDEIPVSKSCRVMRTLDMRAFELKSSVHDVFSAVWNSLVQVDVSNGRVGIFEKQQDVPMNLSEALIGLKAYKEVGQRMALLWHSLDDAIIEPRTNLANTSLPGLKVDDSVLVLSGHADRSVGSLFSDLEIVMSYLSHRLPDELVQSLSVVMMPDLVPRIKSVWLDSVVPVSLKEIGDFQETLHVVAKFCDSLKYLNFTGFDELQEWVDSAPKIWLTKCRESALNTVRIKLAQGLGSPQEVERVETQTVSKTERAELAANGAPTGADEDDWGAAWDDDVADHAAGDRDGANRTHEPANQANRNSEADAWGWGEDDTAAGHSVGPESTASPIAENPVSDDGGEDWDAWGHDATEQPALQESAPHSSSKPQTREITLKETYKISSMPEPMLALISTILEDGAFLVASDGIPVAAAAAGLFGIPTLILAMFRAVSPYWYTLDSSGGGNMFLYNDVTYISERLGDLVTSWNGRSDLAPRAIKMLRLDNDIKTLRSFAARAYSTEMATQRTIILDLLGGVQNVLQQDTDVSDLIMQVDAATSRVRSVATSWSDILSRSAWAQAVGSLVDSLASKIVIDILELSSIGQEQAYNIAKLIEKITELDDLFPIGTSEQPTTSQYVEHWLRLQYLSQFLQSNLNEVKYLWMESDLSLYFTIGEVVDLIDVSFADSPRTREIIREIRNNPQPRE